MFCLYKKIRNLCLPIDCQLKLFDNTSLPILTYECEVWAFGDLSMIEKVQTDFLKYILNVKKVLRIICCIKKRLLGFWYSIVHTGGKLSSTMYKIIYSNYINGHNTYNWLDNVKSILDDSGFSYIWIDQFYLGSKNMLLNLIDTSLKTQFEQTWQSNVNDSSKCTNYRMYKTEHCLEKIF